MLGKIYEVLFTQEQISQRVASLGAEITRAYQGKEILGVCLLKGSIMFTSDLIRHIKVPIQVDVMRASSYQGTESSGNVKILYDLDTDITDRDVLIIEDIVDTGRTLRKILNLFEGRHPRSMRICSLLDKPSRRVVNIDIDFCGFTIEDLFVVGYGLDFQEYYRELPYIGLFEPTAT